LHAVSTGYSMRTESIATSDETTKDATVSPQPGESPGIGDPLFDETAEAFARTADAQIAAGRYVRGQLFVDALKRRAPKRGRVLDYGCGPGRVSRLIAAEGYVVTGLDPSSGMVAVACAQDRDGLALEFGALDADNRFEAAAYDAIVCSSVIEYVEDPEALLRAFHAALVPKGILVVSYVNRASLWGVYARLRNPDAPHRSVQHHLWTRRAAKRVLGRGGFDIVAGPTYYDADGFDRRPGLRFLSTLPCIGTLAIVTAVRR